ncbi:MAG: GH92 family glycosyl hydrolase [Bacteroidales bacterium]|nr:GH92 family glycosyl hydrolase [Bacteroidales bacterium]
MKSLLRFRKICYILVILSFTGCNNRQVSSGGLEYVDPDIGGVGLLLQPTRPTVQLPNQMIRVYPVRKDYLDDQIRYFPLTIISHRLGELFGIMPFTGALSQEPPVSTWDNQLEISTPYFLSTWLEAYNITVEFTPGEKTGYFRFTFPGKSVKNLFLTNLRSGTWYMHDRRTISAEDSFSGMKAFIFGAFNNDGSYRDTIITGRKRQFITFHESSGNVVEFKYAVSFISVEQAKKNLGKEIPQWGFDRLKGDAKEAWEKVMNQIRVEGGSDAQKRTFYTALYRCYERMINITEEGRYYSNYDRQVHEADRDFYVDDWIWDTYLALHPLRNILNPAIEADMIQSYVTMYEQSGWLPTFPVLWGDNPCMNGFHSTVMILDAYRKGTMNFDIAKAYEGMKKNANEATMLPWKNGPACVLDTFYYEHGWYPALHPGEKETVPLVHSFEKRQSVAITLGHSYDDWALAQMAKEHGNKDDYEIFMKKSENYRNLWWPEKGFFMPKDDKGEWIDIDPVFDGGMGGRDYYDENNGWTYLWQVQHDLPGLINLMGGKKAFENRLDQLFRESLGRSKYETWAKFPDFSGIVGQFSMGNEPSFHIPYLYNLTDSPWKTQKKIRMLLDAWYPDNIFGIPGDEDGGGMSAFIVFSSMGFYPLIPGLPVYTIGSPLFEKVTISLPNGKRFSVEAPGGTATNKYIQKAWLNGKPLDAPWFNHSDLINGGTLKLEMGPYPNLNWGKGTNIDSLFANLQSTN